MDEQPLPCPNPKCHRRVPPTNTDLANWHAITCPACGMGGPMARTEPGAVTAWNEVCEKVGERNAMARILRQWTDMLKMSFGDSVNVQAADRLLGDQPAPAPDESEEGAT